MKINIREYSRDEQQKFVLQIIEEYKKGVFTLDSCIRARDVSINWFYGHIRGNDELKQTLLRAKYERDGRHDAEMQQLSRHRVKQRMAGNDKKETKTVTIRAKIKDTNEHSKKTFDVNGETFAAIMEMLSGENVSDVNVEVKVNTQDLPPSDALIVAALQMFDGLEK